MNTAAGVVNGPSTPTRRRPAPSEDHRRDLETVIPSPRSSLYQRVDPADCGELALALRAGMPAARIVVHGNASGEAELSAAVAAGVGRGSSWTRSTSPTGSPRWPPAGAVGSTCCCGSRPGSTPLAMPR